LATFSPLRYPGGKDKTYKYVNYLIKQSSIKTYIEPFAGGAAVALRLLINNDVENIIINDYDKGIYSLWFSILYNSDELIKLIKDTEITMDEWYKQKTIQENKNKENELTLGFSTLFLNRTNRSGIIKAGVIGGKNQDGNYLMDCRFNKMNLIDKINIISSHKNQIELYNLDAKDFIRKGIIKNRKSLTFFDPPYYNKGPDLYTNFYTHEDHKDLADIIKNTMSDNIWIMTYDIHDEIEKLYKEYNYIKYSLNYSVALPTKGQEYMFFSDTIKSGEVSNYLNLVTK